MGKDEIEKAINDYQLLIASDNGFVKIAFFIKDKTKNFLIIASTKENISIPELIEYSIKLIDNNVFKFDFGVCNCYLVDKNVKLAQKI